MTHHPRASDLVAEVRAEMARQSMPLSRLAADLAITVPTLSRKLNGHSPFTLPELHTVAVALGVPLSELSRRAEAVA